MILAIDPGTAKSAYCIYAGGEILEAGIHENSEIIRSVIRCARWDVMAIEMVASYGMAVGKEVFETVRWIGRFQQACLDPEDVAFVYRKDVKIHLCNNMKAKDSNIRQTLIDKIGPQGTKKEPGPTYGIAKDMWSALAVAVTYDETIKARA